MKLGIDYGTTTTQVSYSTDNISNSKLIDIGGNRKGYMRSSIPSVISINKGGNFAIGYEAEKNSLKKHDNFVLLRSLKRCLACERKEGEPAKNCWNKTNLPFCLGNQRMKVFNNSFSARDLVSGFIKELLNHSSVQPQYKKKSLKAIGISVPAIFGSEPRHTTYDLILESVKDELKIDVINEPTAAIIACQKTMLQDKNGIYAILDVGGGTSDIVVYEKEADSYFLFKPLGLPIAGDDVDYVLLKQLFPKIAQSPSERDRALMEIRRAKELLAVTQKVNISNRKLSRSEFEKIIKPVLKKIVSAVRMEIKKIFDIYKPYSQTGQKFRFRKIYLSGGGCKIPLLRELIKQEMSDFEPDIDFVCLFR
jgi:molecular chaperone DnaK (HSP70)